MMTTHIDVSSDLTDEQKMILSDKLEVLMGKYVRLGGHHSDYFNGVIDGLNHTYKLINEIEDDYCILDETTKRE